MTQEIEKMKRIIQAAEAGRLTGVDGRVGNPYDGKDETLRIAFHLGWNMGFDALNGVATPVPAPDGSTELVL